MNNIDKGISRKCPKHTRDFIDNVSATRRSKTNGKSVDKVQLTQLETHLLISYFFAEDNESYKKLINFKFDRDMIKKLLTIEGEENV